MATFSEHLNNVRDFTIEHQSLIDCHLVDFVTENLWEKCLPELLRKQMESVECTDCHRGSQNHFQKLIVASSELCKLIGQADALFLKNSRLITKLSDEFFTFELKACETQQRISDNSMNFMSNKKQYEIAKLAKVVSCLALTSDKNLVIDAGAGKGYLSTSMSEQYRIPVLAVDSSKSHQNSAMRRQEIIQKKKHQKKSLINYAVEHIDEKTNYTQLIQSHCPDWSEDNNCVLTGLHTCGQLAHSMIKSFLSDDCIKSLCVVPCCYHLADETFSRNLILSKNARMLAQQSVERVVSKVDEPHPPSLFYRALLQIILKTLEIPKTRIGRGAPTKDFSTYATWALAKIGIDSNKIPSSEFLEQLYQSNSREIWKFNVFQSIRVYLGSVVEAAIVLDRVIHLETSGRCSKVLLMQLFDPLISPRCYAIVAMKNNADKTNRNNTF